MFTQIQTFVIIDEKISETYKGKLRMVFVQPNVIVQRLIGRIV